MRRLVDYPIVIAATVVLLVSCQMPAPVTSRPSGADPQALFTAAALTAAAKQYLLPTHTAPLATETTPIPTVVTPTTLPTSTGPLVATVDVPTISGTASGDDKAEFVADVSVPDGTTYQSNQVFVKTWRIKNIGITTWTPSYALVFVKGALMSGPPSVPLPRSVAPGETVDISVNLISPAEEGIFQGFWMLRNAAGQLFGVGANASDPLWVIIATAPWGLTNQQATGAPSGTIVTATTLSVKNPMFTGACPYTFIVTIGFTLSNAATVTYSLEAGSESGAEVRLPSSVTRSLEAGNHSVVYELIFSTSITGWLRLHITAPEDVFSNQVNITLTCQ